MNQKNSNVRFNIPEANTNKPPHGNYDNTNNYSTQQNTLDGDVPTQSRNGPKKRRTSNICTVGVITIIFLVVVSSFVMIHLIMKILNNEIETNSKVAALYEKVHSQTIDTNPKIAAENIGNREIHHTGTNIHKRTLGSNLDETDVPPIKSELMIEDDQVSIFRKLDYAAFFAETTEMDLFPKKPPLRVDEASSTRGISSGKDKNKLPVEDTHHDPDNFIMINDESKGAFPWIFGKSHNFSMDQFFIKTINEGGDIVRLERCYMSKKIKFNIDRDYCAYRASMKNDDNLLDYNDMESDNYKNTKRDDDIAHDPFISCHCQCDFVCNSGSNSGRDSTNNEYKYHLKKMSTNDCKCELKSLHDEYSYIVNLAQVIDDNENKLISSACHKIKKITCSVIYLSRTALCNIDEKINNNFT